MDTENWLPAVEEALDAATQWLRSIAASRVGPNTRLGNLGHTRYRRPGNLLGHFTHRRRFAATRLEAGADRCLPGNCRRRGPIHLALAWLCQLRTRLTTIIAQGDNARGHVPNRRNRLTSRVKLRGKAQGWRMLLTSAKASCTY